jgi:Flp pilus assembly protein TadG
MTDRNGTGEKPAARTHQPCGTIRRFLRHERGASMVEFAIVAVPLMALIFGIIEIAFLFWASFELENATAEAARLVRTGQAQQGGLQTANLISTICGRVTVLSGCTGSVRLDVRTFDSFAGITPANPFDANGKLLGNGGLSYSPGGPKDIVAVTAYYEWTLIGPPPVSSLSNMGNGNRLLQASAVFRNEPYQQGQ